jgi:hypothetical protein
MITRSATRYQSRYWWTLFTDIVKKSTERKTESGNYRATIGQDAFSLKIFTAIKSEIIFAKYDDDKTQMGRTCTT